MSQAAGGTGIVIVGGALAGGNAAVTLREEGYRDRVTLIGREMGVPFGRPPLSKTYLRSEEDLADWYVRPAGWYEEHDVDRLVGSSVAVIGTAAHTALLSSGRELQYEKVLIATGGQNRSLKLPGAGLPGLHYLRTVAGCEAIDELCRASAADVYAAGDVANHLHPVFGRVRVEHYNNAEKQGAAAARSMLGSAAPYDCIRSFWSDQYDQKLEYVGHAAKWDEFVVRGSLQERRLVGFYLVNGVVRAAVGLDRGGDPELDRGAEMAAAARLVADQAQPAPGLLADEQVDLWSLGKKA